MIIEALPQLPDSEKTNINNRSLVMLFQIGQHRFLFPGDLEASGERWLIKQNALSPVTVTLAPHHGSNTSSTPAFIKATAPKHVLFSVGRNNRHNFPKPDVVKRWQQSGAGLWRTDQNGTLIFQSDGTTLRTPK